MALKIRLRRMGRKKAPTYRLVVAESSMPRDGRFVANLGHYNPRTEPTTLVVDRDGAREWLAKGARPTDTVHSLLKKAGVYGEEPGVFATAAAAVKETAKQATGKAKSAAAKAAEVVKDAVEEVVETAEEVVDEVKERVAGEPEEAAGEETAEESKE